MRYRIVEHRLAQWRDPAEVFSILYHDSPHAFWLDSGIHAVDGTSYLGESDRWVTASVVDGTVTEHPSERMTTCTVFDFLRERTKPGIGLGGLPLGWVGWLGYELRTQTMVGHEGATAKIRTSKHPDAALLDVDRLIAFDHARRTVELIASGPRWTPELTRWRDETIARLASTSRSPAGEPEKVQRGQRLLPVAEWRDSDVDYVRKIEACQNEIRDGEAYQLCLTSEAIIDTHPHPVDAYLGVRASSPAHHGGFVRVGEVALLSASPESFLTVRDGVVESRPIKGTRPRGATPGEDARLRRELESSDKERAENLMIVDLMRNDIGRVSQLGSVTVPTLLSIEIYEHVHQMVSSVRGRLAAGAHPVDAIVACFPAGSMTGAPKSRAVELLDAVEQRPRGIYSGAFGYISVDGTVDLAMVIRSIVLDADGATIGAGGGITALSTPLEELSEVRLKAAALIDALGAASPPSV